MLGLFSFLIFHFSSLLFAPQYYSFIVVWKSGKQTLVSSRNICFSIAGLTIIQDFPGSADTYQVSKWLWTLQTMWKINFGLQSCCTKRFWTVQPMCSLIPKHQGHISLRRTCAILGSVPLQSSSFFGQFNLSFFCLRIIHIVHIHVFLHFSAFLNYDSPFCKYIFRIWNIPFFPSKIFGSLFAVHYFLGMTSILPPK